MEKNFLKGRNDYPVTLNNTYKVLSNYKAKDTVVPALAGKTGVSFTIDGINHDFSKEYIVLLNSGSGGDDDVKGGDV